MESANNYVVFKKGWFVSQIAYVDTKDHTADEFFEERNFPISFYKEEAQRDNCDYCIVLCRIPTRHLDDFEQIMKDLTVKLLLTGHSDYESFCDSLEFLHENVKREEEEKADR